MAITGPIAHLDISIGDPARSIPFYDVFFTSLGFERRSVTLPEFQGPSPRRAFWSMRYPCGTTFGFEVRPADPAKSGIRYDRYRPGLHHLAFHAESRARVDEVHRRLEAAGADVLDPPTDYSGQSGYSKGYYAAFYADPDGFKLEVLHEPLSNPH